jgi:hypothetical protein
MKLRRRIAFPKELKLRDLGFMITARIYDRRNGFNQICAVHVSQGSVTDMAVCPINVRFTSKSGNRQN